MVRKLTGLALLVSVMLFLVVPVSAAEGSIRVETEENVIVYPVGKPEGIGYRLTEKCGGGYLTFDDTLSAELAAWLSGRMKGEEPIASNPGSSAFADLEEGLYLVCCDAGEGFAPFLVTIPWDGYYWEVAVDPNGETIPQTGDAVGGAILAMAASGAGLTVLGRRRKNY